MLDIVVMTNARTNEVMVTANIHSVLFRKYIIATCKH